MLKSLVGNFLTFEFFLWKFLFRRPKFVFGAGGYACGPVLMAAYILGIPVFILEQNSVMGLTNRILSHFSHIIFTNFDQVKGLKFVDKVKNYGNPLREDFFDMEKMREKSPQEKNYFRVLIFGGSLGSKEINNLVREWVSNYKLEQKIVILHQVGKNNVIIDNSNDDIEYEQREYIENMVGEYLKADFIICRGGASTISELRIVKKPTLIIPLLLHKDQHQLHNAKFLQDEGSFSVYIESGEELIKDQCAKLQSLMKKEFLKINSVDKKISKLDSSSFENPTKLICKEILNHVLQ